MTVSPDGVIHRIRPSSDEELDKGPIVVLNMLKLKEDTEEALDEFLEYVLNVMSGWGEVGMELVYAGKFGELVFGGVGDWDYILLVRYPSRRVFYDMMQSEEYAAIHHGRENTMKMAVLWPTDPVLSFRSAKSEHAGGVWEEKIEKLMAKKK